MAIGTAQEDQHDPRTIEIDTDRILGRRESHYAVIDIGSNSMRLVVYDDLSRAPFPRFNEKSLVALGAGIDDDGRLSEATIEAALDAIGRFQAVADAMGVGNVDVLATEATRRAKNGADLIKAIKARTRFEPRILSGEEEAKYAALGVISGFFQPRGLVGDVGGGSLEIAGVLGDRVDEQVVSMPLGALPVRAMMQKSVASAKKKIDSILDQSLSPFLSEPVFYAVGGGWRALARVHIAMNDWPISVVHAYELPVKEISALAKKVAQMTPEEVAELPDVPSRRVETLAASALVMWRVLRKLKPERVVFSALGLREGWLFAQLDEAEQYRDPLLEGAMTAGLPAARVPAFSEALGRWTDDLFPGEAVSERRIRLAACALTDIAWRDHQKVRAAESFLRLLQFPFIGISHAERAFLAVAIMARYGGKVDETVRAKVGDLLPAKDLQRAEFLGRTLLLGHRLSASVPDILEHARLKIEPDTVRLEISDSTGMADSAAVSSRLQQLAKVIGLEGCIDVTAA